jgi:hypothetical protein
MAKGASADEDLINLELHRFDPQHPVEGYPEHGCTRLASEPRSCGRGVLVQPLGVRQRREEATRLYAGDRENELRQDQPFRAKATRTSE